MKQRKYALYLGFTCSLLLLGCSGSDSEKDKATGDANGNTITRQVPALVIDNEQSESGEFELAESGQYLRENVALTLQAETGSFAGLGDNRLSVPADTTVTISLDSPDAITEMSIQLLSSAPVISVDDLVSNASKLSSISQPEVTSAGSRILYFDGFSDTDTEASLTFNQSVEIQEVQIRTSKHLVNQEFTEDEVSIYAVRPDDGTGTSVTRHVYANSLTDGQYLAVDGRYPREKVKAVIETLSGNLGGYTGHDLKINADTTVKFSIDKDAEFYALELDMIVPSGTTSAEEIVASSDQVLLSLFNKPDDQVQRLSIRSAQSGATINTELTFLTDVVLKNGDLYGTELTVGF